MCVSENIGASSAGVSEAGYEKINQFLKKHGFQGDVNTKKSFVFKFTYPLHVAVKEQDLKMVRLLILAGADTSMTNSSGCTPAQKAWKYHANGMDHSESSLRKDKVSEKIICALGAPLGSPLRSALSLPSQRKHLSLLHIER
jgi:hypothetical protein